MVGFSGPVRAVLFTSLVVFSPGCDRELPVTQLGGSSMGTSWSVRIADAGNVDQNTLGELLQTELDAVETGLSTWIPESELSRLNASTSTEMMPVSQLLCDNLLIALDVNALSDGAFDVTVAPIVDLWGFGPEDSESRVPDAGRILALKDTVGMDKLVIDCDALEVSKTVPGLRIDLSAVAKGYAVDRAAAALDELGVENYLVEVGGEMQLRGRKANGEPWRIGVETPERNVRAVYDALELTDTALASSGDYRNFFEIDGEYYSHTIDPKTGAPVTHNTAAVTVLAEKAGYADAMATALLVMGSGDGLALAERENIAALFLDRTADSRIEAAASSAFANKTSTRSDQAAP